MHVSKRCWGGAHRIMGFYVCSVCSVPLPPLSHHMALWHSRSKPTLELTEIMYFGFRKAVDSKLGLLDDSQAL
jgi:hypothetical protein